MPTTMTSLKIQNCGAVSLLIQKETTEKNTTNLKELIVKNIDELIIHENSYNCLPANVTIQNVKTIKKFHIPNYPCQSMKSLELKKVSVNDLAGNEVKLENLEINGASIGPEISLALKNKESKVKIVNSNFTISQESFVNFNVSEVSTEYHDFLNKK